AARHNGYKRLKEKAYHRREWIFSPGALQITDCIEGAYKDATAFFHLHPDVRATLADGGVDLRLGDGETVKVRFHEAVSVALRDSTWHPAFGQSIPNQRIEVGVGERGLKSCIEWSHLS